MQRIHHTVQRYAWGSTSALQSMLGLDDPGVIAEAWFGAHPSSPSSVDGDGSLDRLIAADPHGTLGDDVVARFGGTGLPYLLKVLAADHPLSLQVHPELTRARRMFAQEEARGLRRDDPVRNYKDANHKPELVYALTPFEAMSGFRAPRRAAEVLDGLDAPLARRLAGVLREQPDADGIRAAFASLLQPGSRPGRAAVDEVVAACRRRLDAGSPAPRSDRTVDLLAREYPGDPGVVTSLLLNPVSLQPGDAMFVPAGGVHAYLHGVAVEIMASSDNVMRAGLTPKHVDVDELLANVDCVAAPPIRIAPEVFYGATKVFYAPVDDFELSVTTIADAGVHPLPGRGPRLLLCLDGSIEVSTARERLPLARGRAMFVPAGDGAVEVRGAGVLVQADVP